MFVSGLRLHLSEHLPHHTPRQWLVPSPAGALMVLGARVCTGSLSAVAS